MPTNGYTRQAEANIQDGLVINSDDLNDEYNALQTAFDNSVGHDHSGNAAGTGQKINLTTGVTGVLPSVNGGTGSASSGTQYGVVYYATTTTLGSTAAGTSVQVLHGNASGTPTWGPIVLTTDVSGVLPVANGGSGITSGVSGGIPYYNSTTTLASSALLTANAIVLGGGAATAPATLGSLGTTTTVLHGNAAGSPTFGAVTLTTDVTGILPLANGGLGVSSGVSGGVPYFNSTSTVASSALLTTNALLLGGGVGASPSALGSLGTTTTLLHGNASGAPTFGAVALTTDVTGTLPVANGGTGVTASTGSTAIVLSTSPTIVTPTIASITGPTAIVGTFNASTSVSDNGNRVISASNKFAASTSFPGTYNTMSLAGVMCGFGSSATITPTTTGRILIWVVGTMKNTTINDGVVAQIRYGTGAAPAAGAALTGSATGSNIEYDCAAANNYTPFALVQYVTGFTLNVAAWVDLSLAAVVGGTGYVNAVTIVITEI